MSKNNQKLDGSKENPRLEQFITDFEKLIASYPARVQLPPKPKPPLNRSQHLRYGEYMMMLKGIHRDLRHFGDPRGLLNFVEMAYVVAGQAVGLFPDPLPDDWKGEAVKPAAPTPASGTLRSAAQFRTKR